MATKNFSTSRVELNNLNSPGPCSEIIVGENFRCRFKTSWIMVYHCLKSLTFVSDFYRGLPGDVKSTVWEAKSNFHCFFCTDICQTTWEYVEPNIMIKHSDSAFKHYYNVPVQSLHGPTFMYCKGSKHFDETRTFYLFIFRIALHVNWSQHWLSKVLKMLWSVLTMNVWLYLHHFVVVSPKLYQHIPHIPRNSDVNGQRGSKPSHKFTSVGRLLNYWLEYSKKLIIALEVE